MFFHMTLYVEVEVILNGNSVVLTETSTEDEFLEKLLNGK